MLTPQQINQIAFSRAAFGGYDMQDVDEFLEPLTEDYITLYKENALLKSKMKVLVGKLEEYRNNEASMKEAVANTQKACDEMRKEAEEKCAQILKEANDTAVENAKNVDSLVEAETERVEEARRLACQKIEDLETQLNACIKALERIKENNRPTPTPAAYDYEKEEKKAPTQEDEVADEISNSLRELMGPADDIAPTADPQHPAAETTTGKFANLRFGPDYDPTK